MPKSLPERARLDWLRKTARQNLRRLREHDPAAKLADAQRELAREYDFASWRALKAHVEGTRRVPPDEAEAAEFLRAVGEGDVDKVRLALADRPELVNAVAPHPFWGGRPQPLHLAIETRRRDLFELLLDAGADVDGRNEAYDRWSPLMLACSPDRADLRQSLLDRGARVGLVEAMLMEDDAAVEALLRPGRGALPPAPNDGSLLAFARTPYAVDRLLALGVPADLADRWGTRPIEAFSRLGERGKALVRHLQSRGIGAQPADYARLGDLEQLAALAERDPAAVRSDAVMMGAVEAGHHDLVRWLLGRGGNPNAKAETEESRHSVLHSAAWRGDLDMVKLLVEAGADVRARDAQYDAPPSGWALTAVTVTNRPECAEVAAWLARLTAD